MSDASYRAKIFEWRDGHQINGAPRQRYWLTHLQDIKRHYRNPDVLAYRLIDPTTMVLRLHCTDVGQKLRPDMSQQLAAMMTHAAAAAKRAADAEGGSPAAKRARYKAAMPNKPAAAGVQQPPARPAAAQRSVNPPRFKSNLAAASAAAHAARAAALAHPTNSAVQALTQQSSSSAASAAAAIHAGRAAMAAAIEDGQLKLLNELSDAAYMAGVALRGSWSASIRHSSSGIPIVVFTSPAGHTFGSVQEVVGFLVQQQQGTGGQAPPASGFGPLPGLPKVGLSAAMPQRLSKPVAVQLVPPPARKPRSPALRQSSSAAYDWLSGKMQDSAICEASRYLLLLHLTQQAAAADITLSPGWTAEVRLRGGEPEVDIISPEGYVYSDVDSAIEHLEESRRMRSRLDILADAALHVV